MRYVRAIVLAVMTALAVAPSALAQWPTTCVELNDIVEAHLGNDGNVGIYQRVFGPDAEAGCRRDHREDVRATFRWAVDDSAASVEAASSWEFYKFTDDVTGAPGFGAVNRSPEGIWIEFKKGELFVWVLPGPDAHITERSSDGRVLFSIVSTTRRTAMRCGTRHPITRRTSEGCKRLSSRGACSRLPSWRFGRRILTVSCTPRPGASRAATLMRIPYARCSPSLPMRLQTYSLRLGLRPACSSTTSSKRISAITATSESIKRFSVTRPSRGVRTITAPTCAKCSPGPSTAPLLAPSGLPSPLASWSSETGRRSVHTYL